MTSTEQPPKVVSTFDALPSKLLSLLHQCNIIHLVSPAGPSTPASELVEWFRQNVKDASALITWIKTGYIGREYIDLTGGNLKVISTYGVGYDHIDVETFRSHNIKVGTTSGVSDDSVADTGLLLLLMIQRRAVANMAETLEGRWFHCFNETGSDPRYLNGSTIRGKKVAFYGFGRIAQKLAERLLPLGPTRVSYKTSKEAPFGEKGFPRLYQLSSTCYPNCIIENKLTLDDLVHDADVVICLTTLTKETKGTLNRSTFAKFKKGAFLINVGRGAVIETEAMIEALRSGQLAGVGLDVIEGEPNITADYPILAADLADKVVLFPHVASAEDDARIAISEFVARNVFFGLGLTEVDLSKVEDKEKREELQGLIRGPTSFV